MIINTFGAVAVGNAVDTVLLVIGNSFVAVIFLQHIDIFLSRFVIKNAIALVMLTISTLGTVSLVCDKGQC